LELLSALLHLSGLKKWMRKLCNARKSTTTNGCDLEACQQHHDEGNARRLNLHSVVLGGIAFTLAVTEGLGDAQAQDALWGDEAVRKISAIPPSQSGPENADPTVKL
jgi:hypothetical protein